MSSCTPTPIGTEPKGISGYIERASSASVWGEARAFLSTQKMRESCVAPYKARISAEFRYGCYCGAFHPSISLPPSISSGEVIPYLESELVRRAPIDDIDALCQVHDVCHARGKETRACNIYFSHSLLRLVASFQQALRSTALDQTDVRTRLIKCSILATVIADIMNGSIPPAISTDQVPGIVDSVFNWTSDLGAIIGSPLYGVQYVALQGDPFPSKGEKCILRRND